MHIVVLIKNGIASWRWFCCVQTEPSKQLHLWRLPEVLIIHLKRFLNVRGMFGGIGRKNELNVQLPTEGLDLRPYLADSMNADSHHIPKYDLTATVNHRGIMEFGHYYSIVRTDKSTQITNFYQYFDDLRLDETQWNLFNDDKVNAIPTDQLSNYSKDAYLLFYRRRNHLSD